MRYPPDLVEKYVEKSGAFPQQNRDHQPFHPEHPHNS